MRRCAVAGLVDRSETRSGGSNAMVSLCSTHPTSSPHQAQDRSTALGSGACLRLLLLELADALPQRGVVDRQHRNFDASVVDGARLLIDLRLEAGNLRILFD